MRSWHQLSVEELMKKLETREGGLSESDVLKRRDHYGENRLVEGVKKPWWSLLLDQVKNTMVLILIAAAVISGFLGDHVEMIAILAIVVLFVLLGFSQEARAEKAMAALKKLSVPKVRVIRDGKEQECLATELVPGDIVLIETGNLVPADMRVIESINLKTQESMLTGEVESVEKHSDALDVEDLALGDRKNSAYMGTLVTYGRGKGVVVETGMKSELGKIATLLSDIAPQETPLQKQLDRIGKQLAIIGVVCALLIMAIGYLSGASFDTLLLTAVSVAVAVVPEGLPAVVTITLALGAQKMLKRHALIRKLPAVETLGSVNIICSDKTGTLTENKMTVTLIDIDGESLVLKERESLKNHRALKEHPLLDMLLLTGVLCSDAKLLSRSEHTFIGDPTEGALVVAANQAGIEVERAYDDFPRVLENPFDSVRKRMSTLHRYSSQDHGFKKGVSWLGEHNFLQLTKGSVDGIILSSSHYASISGIHPLTEEMKAKIIQTNESFASQGIRVLGMAVKGSMSSVIEESSLVFLGMIGMIDPPRSEVKGAIAQCKEAHIRPIMITGDHPLTARFIANELGIDASKGAMTGIDLDKLSPEEFETCVKTVSVYARVSPEHKIRIVECLQKQGNVVAMTGDGVNDSPALKKSDIGVAMGITGTDVSKEASDMVLLDDNFATIVASVEEGRSIFDNIKRFIAYSLAGNIAKVLIMLAAPLFSLWGHEEIAISLFPLQLLWLNLLTDGLLGIGLGVESGEKEVMKRRPNDLNTSIFAGRFGARTLYVGVVLTLFCIAWTAFYLIQGSDKWQTILFTFIALLQITQSFSARTLTGSVFKKPLGGNKVLSTMMLMVLMLQLLIMYWSPMATIFHIVPLAAIDWLSMIVGCILFFLLLEMEKNIKI